MHPEEVVAHALDAIIQGDADKLEAVLDPASLPRLREARGFTASESTDTLPNRDLIAESLASLPVMRSQLRYLVSRRLRDEPSEIDFEVHLLWPHLVPATGAITVIRRDSTWRVVPSLLNPWMLPCFNNLLITDEAAGPAQGN
jgi:hypothetical protein